MDVEDFDVAKKVSELLQVGLKYAKQEGVYAEHVHFYEVEGDDNYIDMEMDNSDWTISFECMD